MDFTVTDPISKILVMHLNNLALTEALMEHTLSTLSQEDRTKLNAFMMDRRKSIATDILGVDPDDYDKIDEIYAQGS